MSVCKRKSIINYFFIYFVVVNLKGNCDLHKMRTRESNEKISFRHELELLFPPIDIVSCYFARGQQHFYRRSDVFAMPRVNCLANRKISDKIFAVESESRDRKSDREFLLVVARLHNLFPWCRKSRD